MTTNLLVRYVGRKESEVDCVAGTGIVWTGLGDVQPVPAKAWEILSKHPDVWELVVDDATEVDAQGTLVGLAGADIALTEGAADDKVVEVDPDAVKEAAVKAVTHAAKKTPAAKKAAPPKATTHAAKKSAAPKAKAPAKADASA